MREGDGGPGRQSDGCATQIVEMEEGFRSLDDPSSAPRRKRPPGR
ncbi:hypothetical protein [Burkholderia pyrrocinia]|nr:hypothetical protein [Burkholderia pyrrocinia]